MWSSWVVIYKFSAKDNKALVNGLMSRNEMRWQADSNNIILVLKLPFQPVVLEVSHFMRYTNLRLTYLLTYFTYLLGLGLGLVSRGLINITVSGYSTEAQAEVLRSHSASQKSLYRSLGWTLRRKTSTRTDEEKMEKWCRRLDELVVSRVLQTDMRRAAVDKCGSCSSPDPQPRRRRTRSHHRHHHRLFSHT